MTAQHATGRTGYIGQNRIVYTALAPGLWQRGIAHQHARRLATARQVLAQALQPGSAAVECIELDTLMVLQQVKRLASGSGAGIEHARAGCTGEQRRGERGRLPKKREGMRARTWRSLRSGGMLCFCWCPTRTIMENGTFAVTASMVCTA